MQTKSLKFLTQTCKKKYLTGSLVTCHRYHMQALILRNIPLLKQILSPNMSRRKKESNIYKSVKGDLMPFFV